MNRFLKIGLISLLVAGALGGAGCKTRPKNITAIPGSEGRGGTTTELTPGTPIVTNPNQGGVPFNPNPNPGRGNTFQPNNGNTGPVDLNPPVNPNGGQGNPAAPTQGELPTGNLRDGMVENREILHGDIIYFDFDKSAVKKGPELAKAVAVAEYLKAHPEAKLEIEGHCDERGTEGYNLALGERRALSIREVLLNNGVPAEKVTTVSYGEARPADPGHDDAAFAKNRRGEFVLLLPPGAAVR
jgi:peptidoglycan-associated lipoprotein